MANSESDGQIIFVALKVAFAPCSGLGEVFNTGLILIS